MAEPLEIIIKKKESTNYPMTNRREDITTDSID